MRTVKIAVFVLGLSMAGLAGPPPALADEASDFKAQIEDLLKRWTGTGEAMTLKTSQPISVEAKGDALVTTLPDLQIAFKEGGSIDLGTISFERRAQPNNRMKIDGTLPPTISVIDPSGKPAAKLALGASKISAVLDADHGLIFDGEGRVADIKIDNMVEQQTLRIGPVTAATRMTERGDGRWVSPGSFEIGEITLTNALAKQLLKVAGVKVRANVDGLILEEAIRWQQLSPKIQALAEQKLPESEMGPKILELLSGMKMPFQAMGYALEVGETQVAEEDGTPAGGIGLARFSMSAKDLDKSHAGFGFGYTHDKLVVPMVDPGMVPGAVDVDIKLDRIPVEALWQILLAEAKAPAGTPEAAGRPDAEQAVQMALLEAKPVLALDKVALATAIASLDLRGQVKVDPASPFMAVATVNAMLRGLEELQKMAAAAGPGGAGPLDPAVLALLGGLGQQEKAADGAVVRRYAVEVAADGKITVNGNDMSALMGGGPPPGGPGGPPPGAAPAPGAAQPGKPPKGGMGGGKTTAPPK